MIYAKVDVKLRDHVRAQRAGEAMATWTWGLLYAREQETDGHIPDVALRGSWVGEQKALEHAARLVEVGLWAVAEDGWTICRYDQKNETRAAIEERRSGARERMMRVRNPFARTSGEQTPNRKGANSGAVPGSGSGSGSDSSRGESERGPTDPPPEWFAKVVTAISTSSVTDLRLGDCWTAYCGHATDKGKRPNDKHAAYWLTTVMVPKARDEARAAARQRERDKRFADHRPRYDKPTAAQTAEFGKSLQARVAEQIAAEVAALDAKKGAA